MVNASSIAGRRASALFGVYNLTKFGVNGFTLATVTGFEGWVGVIFDAKLNRLCDFGPSQLGNDVKCEMNFC
ncbi:hypothetical protein GCM10007874_36020 [Labrys miyagiensis]|uniref:Uncharacterized protein n=1 Tax=Labrys miyagiensis TaxID=346912 RepID=A0ABQ6CK81_9HYPH|nr:hypothetical protein GCM10007874_36020 [Labrys miyagiensis]